MTAEQTAAILNDAVEVLAERGWRQGPRTLEDIVAHRWPGCRVGDAILFAATGHIDVDLDVITTLVEYALAEWIGENPDRGPVSWRDPESLAVDVDAWNDAPGRTIADVVRALRGAARLAVSP